MTASHPHTPFLGQCPPPRDFNQAQLKLNMQNGTERDAMSVHTQPIDPTACMVYVLLMISLKSM